MVGNEDADVAVFQLPNDVLDVFNCNGVDASKGLVEHDELRFDGQTAGYLGAASLTTRELVALVLTNLLQAELADETFKFLELILMRFAGHLEHRHDIVLHRHLTKHRRFLWQIADASTCTLINRIGSDFLVAQKDVSAIRYDKASGHVE